MKSRLALALVFALSVVSVVRADSVVSTNPLFNGFNIYSPSVIIDGVYKMYYGGWQQQSDLPNDKIFYRTSSDTVNWSAPTTILSPSDVSSNAVQINDPNVTLHYNTISQSYQYTMFYTVCVNPCSVNDQSTNQIWSSVSNDGIHWAYHQPLLTSALGSAGPSATIEPSSDGTFWKLYYADRLDANKIKMVRVNGYRQAMNYDPYSANNVVYTSSNTVSDPEMRLINNQWQLFYQALFADRVDIYKVVSNSNTSWTASPEALLQNTGPNICGTITPTVFGVGNNQYDMYFGLTTRTSPNTCDLTQQKSIHKWRWND